MQGYIKLHRILLESKIWQKNPAYLKIFLYILLKVNHTQNQFFREGENYFNFKEEIRNIPGVTYNQVHDFLRWAKSDKVEILTTRQTTKGVVLKVNNWVYYQGSENEQLQSSPQFNSNSLPINFQSHKQECKNERNNNLLKSIKFIPPTIGEIKQYCIERKNKIDAEHFFNFYDSKDWMVGKNKMKNWKSSVITWEVNQKKFAKNNAARSSTMPENQQYTEHEKKCLELGLPFDAVIND